VNQSERVWTQLTCLTSHPDQRELIDTGRVWFEPYRGSFDRTPDEQDKLEEGRVCLISHAMIRLSVVRRPDWPCATQCRWGVSGDRG
jgi:hypothetical protein